MIKVYIKVFCSSAPFGSEFHKVNSKYKFVNSYDDSLLPLFRSIVFDDKFPRDRCSIKVEFDGGCFIV